MADPSNDTASPEAPATPTEYVDLLRAVVETLTPPEAADGHDTEHQHEISTRLDRVVSTLTAVIDEMVSASGAADTLRRLDRTPVRYPAAPEPAAPRPLVPATPDTVELWSGLDVLINGLSGHSDDPAPAEWHLPAPCHGSAADAYLAVLDAVTTGVAAAPVWHLPGIEAGEEPREVMALIELDVDLRPLRALADVCARALDTSGTVFVDDLADLPDLLVVLAGERTPRELVTPLLRALAVTDLHLDLDPADAEAIRRRASAPAGGGVFLTDAETGAYHRTLHTWVQAAGGDALDLYAAAGADTLIGENR